MSNLGCPHGHLPPCTQCQQEAYVRGLEHRVAELEKRIRALQRLLLFLRKLRKLLEGRGHD